MSDSDEWEVPEGVPAFTQREIICFCVALFVCAACLTVTIAVTTTRPQSNPPAALCVLGNAPQVCFLRRSGPQGDSWLVTHNVPYFNRAPPHVAVADPESNYAGRVFLLANSRVAGRAVMWDVVGCVGKSGQIAHFTVYYNNNITCYVNQTEHVWNRNCKT